MATIVMTVDLECDRCYKKIRRVLCKLQDKASIKTISYDEKSNTVTVSGPFDAEEVSDRLSSSAGKVITDIRVVRGNNAKPAAKAPANKPAGKDSGGGGGKPEIIKKHVKFDLADDDDNHHHNHQDRKPKVVTPKPAAAADVSRLEAPRVGLSMPMATMAPVPMPMTAVQAAATPSIWPAPAPEWGHSVPAYGSGWAQPAGGYYGGGYGPPPLSYGYGRSPYQPQYYDEEPAAGCSVM
ncbi:hypothetical protein GUJ93_ZPchr0003g16843 [Zizania palustris]|nr:hypothetical protein GUJ93_ZPchr0003g16843 [Zizania palustris]